MILYGIPTCDTCKKARKALEAAGETVAFRDVRADPLSKAEITHFVDAFGDRIINRASTTWRGLSDWLKEAEADAQLAAQPTVMKRPVIDTGHELLLGWGPEVQEKLLK